MNPVNEQPLLPAATGSGPHASWALQFMLALRRVFADYGFRLNRTTPLDGSEASRLAGLTVSPAQITGHQTSYDPGDGQVARLDADALGPWSIRGLEVKETGEFVWLVNVGANAINLTDQDAGNATAEERIMLKAPPGPFSLAADQATLLWYDSTTARWRQLA